MMQNNRNNVSFKWNVCLKCMDVMKTRYLGIAASRQQNFPEPQQFIYKKTRC